MCTWNRVEAGSLLVACTQLSVGAGAGASPSRHASRSSPPCCRAPPPHCHWLLPLSIKVEEHSCEQQLCSLACCFKQVASPRHLEAAYNRVGQLPVRGFEGSLAPWQGPAGDAARGPCASWKFVYPFSLAPVPICRTGVCDPAAPALRDAGPPASEPGFSRAQHDVHIGL